MIDYNVKKLFFTCIVFNKYLYDAKTMFKNVMLQTELNINVTFIRFFYFKK